MRLLTVSTLAAAALAFAAPASAALETFASFSPIGIGTAARNIRWTVSANNAGGNLSKNATFFSISTPNGAAAGGDFARFTSDTLGLSNTVLLFTLNGTVTNTIATVSGTQLTQTKVNGTFSFIDTLNNAGFGANKNILSGTFSNTIISGARNSGSAVWNGQGAGPTFNFTSDVFRFAPTANYAMEWGLGTFSPLLNASGISNSIAATPNKALRSFVATVGGSFQADPPPLPPAVPEPAIWAQLIIGFSMVGFASRRRKVSVAA